MLLVCASLTGIVASVVPVAARNSARHAAMILDANTGAVLYNDDGDEPRHPASLTKMMTLYLTFETIDSGRLKMTDRIRVSEEAASATPSSLELKAGDNIAVEDAIKALITKSANDVAIALAEKIGGSEKNFVRLMNARAKDIGMIKTNFENASGLPDSDQVTTARDMVTLGLRLQDDYPKYYPLFALSSFTYDGRTHRNHNTLMNHFTGIDGIKTGYTSASGFNLVSSFHRGGRHLIGAVFGGSSAGSRNAEMRNLLTRMFNRASSSKTRKAPPSPLIAALKLKSEPKLAERTAKPKPKPVVFAEAPAKAAAATASVEKKASVDKALPEPVPASTPPANAQPLAAPPLTAADMPAEPLVAVHQLEMAKVKHISMADAQQARRTRPKPEETTDMPEEMEALRDVASLMATPASQTKDVEAAPDAAAALSGTFAAASGGTAETIVPKLASAAPDVLPSALDKRAMLGAADTALALAAPVAPPEPLSAAPAPPAPALATKTVPIAKPKVANLPATPKNIQKGLPPSTLQAQAAAVRATAPSSQGRYDIQIGAYGSIDEAQKSLAAVQNRAGSLLQNAASVTLPVQSAGRQMFRARFSGFDSAGATRACNELRRQSVDCFVMTAQ